MKYVSKCRIPLGSIQAYAYLIIYLVDNITISIKPRGLIIGKYLIQNGTN